MTGAVDEFNVALQTYTTLMKVPPKERTAEQAERLQKAATFVVRHCEDNGIPLARVLAE